MGLWLDHWDLYNYHAQKRQTGIGCQGFLRRLMQMKSVGTFQHPASSADHLWSKTQQLPRFYSSNASPPVVMGLTI